MVTEKTSQVAGTTSEEIMSINRCGANMNIYQIYFYKENGNNIPIMNGSTNDTRKLTYLSKEELEEIYRRFPTTRDNLYVLIDGVEFKVG